MLEQLITDAITDPQWFNLDTWDNSREQEAADAAVIEELGGDAA